MPYRQLFRLHNGAYIPVRIVLNGRIYYDPFDLRIHMNNREYGPDEFPDELSDTLSWDEYLELQFFKLTARVERSRRDKGIEKKLLESFELKVTIQMRNPTYQ